MKWYSGQISNLESLEIILLTDDSANREIARDEGILVYSSKGKSFC